MSDERLNPSEKKSITDALNRENLRVVLQILRELGPQSRADLAKLTGLSAPATANIYDELSELGLVQQGGRQKTSRGQPPISIELNKFGAGAAGIRIDANGYEGVAINLVGEVIAKREGTIQPGEVKDWTSFISDIYLDIANEVRELHGGIPCFGLGLVAPGPFDIPWPGVPTAGAIAEVQKRNISSSISTRIGQPVYVENDATAAAFSERLYGDARGSRNYFYIYVGEGVGSGMVINGAPYRGDRGNAGEFGHIIVNPAGSKCNYCGNNGCLGSYVSLNSRKNALQAAKDAGVNLVEAEQAWLREAIEALSIGIANIENILEPEFIILGGTAPKAILDALMAGLQELRPSIRKGLGVERLVLSQLGKDGVALAAASLPILASTSTHMVFK